MPKKILAKSVSASPSAFYDLFDKIVERLECTVNIFDFVLKRFKRTFNTKSNSKKIKCQPFLLERINEVIRRNGHVFCDIAILFTRSDNFIDRVKIVVIIKYLSGGFGVLFKSVDNSIKFGLSDNLLRVK